MLFSLGAALSALAPVHIVALAAQTQGVPLLALLHPAALALAVSTDVFVGFCTCGGRDIRLKRGTAIVSALACAVIFLVFGLIGSLASPLVPDRAERLIGFACLLLIGLTRIFDRAFKALLLRFRRSLATVFKIYAEPELADLDRGGDLSLREGVLLASATSIDAAITALGSGLVVAQVVAASVFSIGFAFAAVVLGVSLGRYLSGKLPVNVSVLGGVILIALAVLKLL